MQENVSHKELCERLDYNKETGWFTWKVVKSKKVKVGDRAGYEHHGYRYITINDKEYSENRLAWFYVTHAWPNTIVDHKNLDRSDNRWDNLRLNDDSGNQHNTTVRLNNRLGFLGVRKHGKLFRARIAIQGIRYHLGDYATPELAAKAYEEARAQAFGPRVHTEEDISRAIEKRIARIGRQLGYKKKKYQSPRERFYGCFKKDKVTGCWNWTGRTWDKTGYGVFKSKELNPRPMTASRASWIIHNGPITEPKMVIRHTCDNPLCVNPKHLIIGTYKQNSDDCVKRGRINRGEDRPQSKLTEAKVREARQLRQKGASWRFLANKYGVATYCIVCAVKGITWKHVDESIPTIESKPGRHKGGAGELVT
jgi:hypothetical protein